MLGTRLHRTLFLLCLLALARPASALEGDGQQQVARFKAAPDRTTVLKTMFPELDRPVPQLNPSGAPKRFSKKDRRGGRVGEAWWTTDGRQVGVVVHAGTIVGGQTIGRVSIHHAGTFQDAREFRLSAKGRRLTFAQEMKGLSLDKELGRANARMQGKVKVSAHTRAGKTQWGKLRKLPTLDRLRQKAAAQGRVYVRGHFRGDRWIAPRTRAAPRKRQ